jgi:para-aminobenzoate synthetase component 1
MESFRFRPRVTRLVGEIGSLSLVELLLRMRDAVAGPALFDSAAGSPARFSVLGFDPLPVPPPRSLDGLEAYVRSLAPEEGDPLPAWFRGGFLGALAYDLGVAGESLALPADPLGMPPIAGGLYVDFLVREHESGTTWLVLGEDPGDGRPSVAERSRRLFALLGRAGERRPLAARGPLVRSSSAERFQADVERVRSLIAAGEVYQANLSQRFTRILTGDPLDLYLRLRELHPGPYLGFLRFEGGALLSGSPECLLDFEPAGERGGQAVARTRPIKGTAPRGATPEEDRANARALLASAKDLAELAMIVDLERNDLGRVAERGGVSVDAFPRLESYATVHHLVADVAARIPPGTSGFDVLAALFPGGSITGAPKLRSMEAIAEIEGEGRGFAYGSQCLADTCGRIAASVLIRTLVWRDLPSGAADASRAGSAEVAFRVGGGITFASDPPAEEAESRVKGLALARALECVPA